MTKVIILLIILSSITCKIPEYALIKRNEFLSFKLDNSDSSFYAYLPFEEDYEIGEESNELLHHFFKLDKKIGFKHRIIEKNESFPDELFFNKSSKEWDNNYKTLEVYENVRLKEYAKLKNNSDENRISIFVFYIEEQFKDSFDPNEIFSVGRINYNTYLNDTIINDELKADSLNLYGFTFNSIFRYNRVLFINSPISSVYEYHLGEYKKNNSNIHIYTCNYKREIENIFLIAYNPNNYNQKIYIEYENNIDTISLYNFIDLKGLESNRLDGDSFIEGVLYVSIDQPGLYNIKTNGNYKYLFNDDINDIKNLTELKNIEHYKYINGGPIYISNNYFIVMISSTQYVSFTVTKIEIKEVEKEINMLSFEYFKISNGNSLNFNLNKSNQNVILKLLSNNDGNVNINNNNYYFNKNEVKVINVNDEQFKINALDNNFTFAIKLKIPEEFIEFPEFGESYILPTDTYYKFLIYKINTVNYSYLHFSFNETQYIKLYYEFISEKNLNEISKGEIDRYAIKSPKLYFNNYKNKLQNESLYLSLYIENLTNKNIDLETKYYKSLEIKEDNFTLLEYSNYMDLFKEKKRGSIFIIPCVGHIQTFIQTSVSYKYHMFYKPFKFSFEGQFNDFLQINVLEQNKGNAFVNYYKLGLQEKDYFYREETMDEPKEPEYGLDELNKTHFILSINEIFSDSPQINFIFVITSIENEHLLEPRCQFFNNFYLNEAPKLDNLEIYNFSYDNPVGYISLPIQKKNFLNKSQRLVYKLMGITGPKFKYIRFYNSYYYKKCYETCSECIDIGNEQNHNCTSCINGKLFQKDKGNCLDQCPSGYYQTGNICKSYIKYLIIGIAIGVIIIVLIIICIIKI